MVIRPSPHRSKLLEGLEKTPPAAVLALSAAGIGFVAWFDYLTGPDLSFSLFYLVPVSFTAWISGWRSGIGMAVLASAAWCFIEICSPGHPERVAILVWNAGIRLGFFLVVARLLAALKAALDTEESLADTDALTGLANKRSFHEFLDREVHRLGRYRGSLTLAYIDLDGFKAVNDMRGHATGDEVLKTVARTLERGSRRSDVCARLGGDEFAVLFLMGNSPGGERAILANLQVQLTTAMVQEGWDITFSIGAVVLERAPKSSAEVLAAADALMYEVKRTGKNAVRVVELNDPRFPEPNPRS